MTRKRRRKRKSENDAQLVSLGYDDMCMCMYGKNLDVHVCKYEILCARVRMTHQRTPARIVTLILIHRHDHHLDQKYIGILCQGSSAAALCNVVLSPTDLTGPAASAAYARDSTLHIVSFLRLCPQLWASTRAGR